MSKTNNAGMGVISSGYSGSERRNNEERRLRPDQRSGIRFDEKGGDRRDGFGRRESDEGLRFLD